MNSPQPFNLLYAEGDGHTQAMDEKMTHDVEDLILKLAFLPLAEVSLELTRHGIKNQLRENGQSIVVCAGITGGFGEGDPISRAAVLGFVLAGPRWAASMPDLFPRINREWKQRSKKRKTHDNPA